MTEHEQQIGDALRKFGIPHVRPMTDEEYKAAVARQFRQLDDVLCPNCEQCNGTGWVRVGDGMLVPCPNMDMRRLPGFISYIGITPDEVDRSHWGQLRNLNGMAECVRAVRATLHRGWGWVYVWGDYGVGKTELLRTATAVAVRNKVEAAYVRLPDLMDHLRDMYDPETKTAESGKLSFWQGRKVLALDELDKLRTTEWASERRFVLLDRRYEMATRSQDGVTLMASNEPPDSLPGWLADRVLDSRNRVIEMKGKSVRRILNE